MNHLSYVDDLIPFSSGDIKSIKILMKALADYQDASFQEVNKEKCFFLTHDYRNKRTSRKIRRWTGFKQSNFPLTYLGCPIYMG